MVYTYQMPYFWNEKETGQGFWLNQITVFMKDLQWYIEMTIV